jgi:hypothetical protein
MTEGKAKTRKYQEQYFRERENIKKRDTKWDYPEKYL